MLMRQSFQKIQSRKRKTIASITAKNHARSKNIKILKLYPIPPSETMRNTLNYTNLPGSVGAVAQDPELLTELRLILVMPHYIPLKTICV